MPEYSSTTITPADGVKTPAMNGSTSGNYQLSALRDFILASKGQANGLASLGADGKLTASQLPDLADDVIVATSYATLPSPGIAGKLYITADGIAACAGAAFHRGQERGSHRRRGAADFLTVHIGMQRIVALMPVQTDRIGGIPVRTSEEKIFFSRKRKSSRSGSKPSEQNAHIFR